MEWRKYPVVYEIHTEVWLEQLSNKYQQKIDFSNIPDFEIDKLKKMKIDSLWLMGIWKRSDKALENALNEEKLIDYANNTIENFNKNKDITASSYSIADYQIEEKFGGKQAYLSFKEKIKPINIILDFVPNHTSLDHRWTKENPEIYIQGNIEMIKNKQAFKVNNNIIAMGKDPNFAPWTDTAQLDYSKDETREKMFEQLLTISSICDGVRCDMAMLVTNQVFKRTWGKKYINNEEFWIETIKKVKYKNSNFLFIAEVYWNMEWDLQQMGFDYTYDKRLYDRLKNNNFEEVRYHLFAEKIFYQHLLRFIENHDEDRAYKVWKDNKYFTASILTYTLPGLRLLYQGQLTGKQINVPIQFKRWPQETENKKIKDFYLKLLEILSSDIFHEGEWKMLSPFNPETNDFNTLFVYLWTLKKKNIIVLSNHSEVKTNGFLSLEFIRSEKKYLIFKELFSGKEYKREKMSLSKNGWFFDLEPFEGLIFQITD